MTDRPDQTDQPGPKYLAVVGSLLLLIIVSLAVLWQTETRRRRDAVRRLAELQAKYGRIEGVLGDALTNASRQAGPVRREDLPAETMELNGREVVALRLGAAAGERFGFRPGDLILVAETSEPPVPTTAAEK